MYRVQKNVPIPQLKTNPAREPKYPFLSMDKGDCFFIRVTNTDAIPSVRSSVYASFLHYCRANNIDDRKLVTRVMEKKLGVWVIEKEAERSQGPLTEQQAVARRLAWA